MFEYDVDYNPVSHKFCNNKRTWIPRCQAYVGQQRGQCAQASKSGSDLCGIHNRISNVRRLPPSFSKHFSLTLGCDEVLYKAVRLAAQDADMPVSRFLESHLPSWLLKAVESERERLIAKSNS